MHLVDGRMAGAPRRPSRRSTRCRARAPRSRTAAARARARSRRGRARSSSALLRVHDAEGHLDADTGRLLCSPVRVHVVDPPAYTPPYDHALCAALARRRRRRDARDEPLRLRRRRPPSDGYRVERGLLPPGAGAAGRARAARQAGRSTCPTCCATAAARADADVVHFQWLSVQQLDVAPAPARTAARPDRARRAAARAAPRAARRAAAPLRARRRGRRPLRARPRVAWSTSSASIPRRCTVIPHGAFMHLLDAAADACRCRASSPRSSEPVVLLFGLMRPYKGIDVALEAWRGIDDAELWVVGMPRMDTAPLRAAAPPGVRFVERFVGDRELPAFFRRADLVVLPYREIDQSGVLFTALAFGASAAAQRRSAASRRSPRPGAAELVPPGDAGALRAAIGGCSRRRGARRARASAPRGGARALRLGRRSRAGHSRSTSALAAMSERGCTRVAKAHRLLGLCRPAGLRPGRLSAAARRARPCAPAARRRAAATRTARSSRSSRW